MSVNFDLNFWFFLALLLAVTLVICIWRAQRREGLWRESLNAFSARHTPTAFTVTAQLGGEAAWLWERLLSAHSALEESVREGERARRDLEDVLASLQDAVLVVDDEARLRYLNAAALQLFEVRIEDVLGANLIEALPSFGLDSAMRAALQGGQSSAQEVHLYAPRLREVFLRVAPISSAVGGATGAVAIVQDLTEMRRLERVRRDFVANASHELRTPIANIRAAAETMQEADQEPAVIARFLPPLVEESERLSNLISDLLDLARAENAESTPLPPVNFIQAIQSALKRLQNKATRRNIAIQFLASTAPSFVAGDAAGLEQAVYNLLDNALAYTPAGGQIELRLQRTEANLVLEVADTGIGIPETDLSRIFERFYRVDKARSRAEGGTGLGLAIVKHIIETHGGHIEAHSELEKGSTFRLELPILAGATEDNPSPEASAATSAELVIP